MTLMLVKAVYNVITRVIFFFTQTMLPNKMYLVLSSDFAVIPKKNGASQSFRFESAIRSTDVKGRVSHPGFRLHQVRFFLYVAPANIQTKHETTIF
jgi:hypothetical protein